MDKIKVTIIEKPTNKPAEIGSLVFNSIENIYSIIKHKLEIETIKISNKLPIDLYLVSEERCDIGDWYYEPDQQKFLQVTKEILPVFKPKSPFTYFRLEATTNKDFNLPKIPTWFIDFFVKKNGKIDSVNLDLDIKSACECDTMDKLSNCMYSSGLEECHKRFPNGEYWHKFPKTDNDFVIITKEKETLTVEEVQHMFDIIAMMISEKHNYSKDETNAFIDECHDFLKDEINLLK